MMKCYRSKVYVGKNYDAIVTSYYGSNSWPSDFYEVGYRVHTNEDINLWRSVNYIYKSKSSALKRAREIALNY